MDHSSDFHSPPPPPPPHHRRGLFIPKTLIIAIVVFALGWWIGGMGLVGGEQEDQDALQTIKVTGTGVVEVTEAQADEVMMSGTIETRTGTAGVSEDAAREENTRAVEHIERELVAMGLRSSDFRIYQAYSIPKPLPTVSLAPRLNNPTTPTPGASGEAGIQAAYFYDPNAVRSSVSITLDKTNAKLADSISSKFETFAARNGYDNTRVSISSTSYILKEASRIKFEKDAGAAALQDAKTQIDNIAKINKLKVGKTLSIEKQENKDKDRYYSPDTYYQKSTSVSASYDVEYEVSNQGIFGL